MGKSFAHKGFVGPADGAPVKPDIVHLYQHRSNHGPQAIVANVTGLIAIRDAIDSLLASPDPTTGIRIAAVPGDDGEGYSLGLYKIDKPFTDRVWDDLPSTYDIVDDFGDRIWAIDCAVQQKWPCPVCHGFGKKGVKTNLFGFGTDRGKRSDFIDESEAIPCDGPCGGSGQVTEKPKEETPASEA